MRKMEEIIKKSNDGQFLLEISRKIYDINAILKAAYKFTDTCYVHVDSISEGILGVYFKARDRKDASLENIVNDFCNELIDQQIRVNLEKEYSSIRDQIVKKAFSPIDK